MRRNPLASRRYAQAFFDLTDKRKEALVEINTFAEVLEKNKAIEGFFTNPTVSTDEKKVVLAELKSKFPVSILFFEALIDANRMECLRGVADEFSRMVDDQSGELSVEVESASALSDSALEEIQGLLQDKWRRKLKVRTTTNPALIGGFIARAPGKLLDASVANQIENLEAQIFA